MTQAFETTNSAANRSSSHLFGQGSPARLHDGNSPFSGDGGDSWEYNSTIEFAWDNSLPDGPYHQFKV